ncbi:hypothetical protein ACFL4L_04915 [bacterium]
MKTTTRILGLLLVLLFANNAFAQVGLGGDVVSRYVWRGTDLGGSLSVQPALSYTTGHLEIGAWGSYALTDGGFNENDIYLTYTIGDLGITVTDYYFPETMDAFNYKDEDGIHWLEASLSYGLGDFSLLAGYFFSGDPDNSMYFEAGYDFYEKDDISAGLVVGAGDGAYLMDSEDLNVVNIGITASSGRLSVSYIINPQAETNFIVFGYSF